MQKMTEQNPQNPFVMAPADLSMTSSSMSAKSGVGTEQLSTITAALQALQSSMLTMNLVSEPVTSSSISNATQENEARV